MGHIFISYSRRDRGFVSDLVRDLTARGQTCWLDVHDIGGADRWRQKTAEAVQTCEAFLLVISEHSASSDDVENELALAEASGRRLYPIRYQAINPPNWMKYSLSRVQWIDFVDTPYEEAFAYLMKALVPQEAPTASEPKYISWIALAYTLGALFYLASFGTCFVQSLGGHSPDCLQGLGLSFAGLIGMNTLLAATVLCGVVLFVRWQLAAPFLVAQWIALAGMSVWAMQRTGYGMGFLIAMLVTAPAVFYVIKVHRQEALAVRRAEGLKVRSAAKPPTNFSTTTMENKHERVIDRIQRQKEN